MSLIPLKKDNVHLKGLEKCYLDCQQMLDMRCGDIDEHSILLCNLFNYVDETRRTGYSSYLVFGYSIPYTKCAFVLRKNKEDKMQIWDPLLGECY